MFVRDKEYSVLKNVRLSSDAIVSPAVILLFSLQRDFFIQLINYQQADNNRHIYIRLRQKYSFVDKK